MSERGPTARPSGWSRAAAALMWVWIALVGLVSWLSGFADQSCADPACADRAQAGWAVLMVLQLAWAVGVLVLMRRPAWRRWGLLAGTVLPPATLAVVAWLAYPPGSLF